MANLLSLLSKKVPFRFAFGEQVLMDIELVEDITHTFTSTIAKTEGAFDNKSDNIKNEPIIIQMTCRISDNPVSLSSNLQGLTSSLLPSNPLLQKLAGEEITKFSAKMLEGSANRREDFFRVLMDIRNKKIPFSVVTGLKIYQNMFFTQLVVDEDKTAINCLVFNATLQECPIKIKTSKGKKKLGQKKVKEVETPENSILFNLKTKYLG